jgi:hypothetical protein
MLPRWQIAGLAALLSACSPGAPSNDDVARAFKQHRSEYTQLRDMLLADTQIASVATWGVQKIGQIGSAQPPAAEMSADRYQAYMRLLSRVGATATFRQGGNSNPQICTAVWRAGLGDAIHVWVCWLNGDARQRSSAASGLHYYPLGDHWYIRKDFD